MRAVNNEIYDCKITQRRSNGNGITGGNKSAFLLGMVMLLGVMHFDPMTTGSTTSSGTKGQSESSTNALNYYVNLVAHSHDNVP